MSQENLGSKSFVAGEDLEAYRRVKFSSGNVVYADAGEEFIGVTSHKALNTEQVTVNLRSASRTYKMVASGAITAGNTIYGAIDGKVSTSASGVAQGVALEAATADGDVIECFQNNGVAGAIDGASTAIGDPAVNGSVPVIFAWSWPDLPLRASPRPAWRQRSRPPPASGSTRQRDRGRDSWSRRLRRPPQHRRQRPHPLGG